MPLFTLPRAIALFATLLALACSDAIPDETIDTAGGAVESTSSASTDETTTEPRSPKSDAGRPPPPNGGCTGNADGGPPPEGTERLPHDPEACGSCQTGSVCCEAPAPCAGWCVHDCRVHTERACPEGRSCDGDTGLCK